MTCLAGRAAGSIASLITNPAVGTNIGDRAAPVAAMVGMNSDNRSLIGGCSGYLGMRESGC